ncbi:MAG: hypothetical protein E6I90_03160, partial [Chloroflexi bacterium]
FCDPIQSRPNCGPADSPAGHDLRDPESKEWMCSHPHVVDMYIHSLLDKLDQGFSRPRIKTVHGVGYNIEA